MRKLLAHFVGILIILFFCGIKSQAKTIYVPQDYLTIQEADPGIAGVEDVKKRLARLKC